MNSNSQGELNAEQRHTYTCSKQTFTSGKVTNVDTTVLDGGKRNPDIMVKADTSSGCTARSEEEHGLPETVTSRRVEGEMSDGKGDGSGGEVTAGKHRHERWLHVPTTSNRTTVCDNVPAVRMSITNDSRNLTMTTAMVNNKISNCHESSTEKSTLAMECETLEGKSCVRILRQGVVTAGSVPMHVNLGTSSVPVTAIVDHSPSPPSVTLQLNSPDAGSTIIVMVTETQGECSTTLLRKNGHKCSTTLMLKKHGQCFQAETIVPVLCGPRPVFENGTHKIETGYSLTERVNNNTLSARSSLKENKEETPNVTMPQQFPMSVTVFKENGIVVGTLFCHMGGSRPMSTLVQTSASCLPATLRITMEQGQGVEIISLPLEDHITIHISVRTNSVSSDNTTASKLVQTTAEDTVPASDISEQPINSDISNSPGCLNGTCGVSEEERDLVTHLVRRVVKSDPDRSSEIRLELSIRRFGMAICQGLTDSSQIIGRVKTRKQAPVGSAREQLEWEDIVARVVQHQDRAEERDSGVPLQHGHPDTCVDEKKRIFRLVMKSTIEHLHDAIWLDIRAALNYHTVHSMLCMGARLDSFPDVESQVFLKFIDVIKRE